MARKFLISYLRKPVCDATNKGKGEPFAVMVAISPTEFGIAYHYSKAKRFDKKLLRDVALSRAFMGEEIKAPLSVKGVKDLPAVIAQAYVYMKERAAKYFSDKSSKTETTKKEIEQPELVGRTYTIVESDYKNKAAWYVNDNENAQRFLNTGRWIKKYVANNDTLSLYYFPTKEAAIAALLSYKQRRVKIERHNINKFYIADKNTGGAYYFRPDGTWQIGTGAREGRNVGYYQTVEDAKKVLKENGYIEAEYTVVQN